MKTIRIEVWKARKGWTWRMMHRNGNTIANAAETYDDRTKGRRAGVNMGKILGCAVHEIDGDTTLVVRAADPSIMTPAQQRNAARKVASIGGEVLPAMQVTAHPTAPEMRTAAPISAAPAFPIPQRTADDTRDDGSRR
jgi:uncharacterized protein YegP (UPF0339 family)